MGVAAAAGMPIAYALPAAVGAVIGYTLPMSVAGGMKYVAAIGVIMAVRLIIRGRKIECIDTLMPLFSVAAVGAFSLAAVYSDYIDVFAMALAAADSVIAGAGTFFIRSGASAIEKGYGFGAMNKKQLAGVYATSGIILLALCSVTVSGFSLGRCIGVLAAITAAYCIGPSVACTIGVLAGLVSGMNRLDYALLTGVYGFAAMTAGVFSVFGRLGSATAFIIISGFVVMMSGTAVFPIILLYEIMAATVIFMLLPAKYLSKITELAAKDNALKADNTDTMRRRLAKAGVAVEGIVKAVSAVSAVSCDKRQVELSDEISECVCAKCGRKIACWETRSGRTLDSFNKISSVLKKENGITMEQMPEYLKENCLKIGRVMEKANEIHHTRRFKQSRELIMDNARSVAVEQLTAMSGILKDIAAEPCPNSPDCNLLEEKVRRYLEKTGVYPSKISCERDSEKRMTLIIEIATDEIETISRVRLGRAMSEVCGCVFALPEIDENDGVTVITLYQQPYFTAKFAFKQSAYKGVRHCGDTCRAITGRGGNAGFVLSDGMGSGTHAAVDSAMTSSMLAEMIGSGINPENALMLANTAMVIKSAEESIATADIAAVSLYTGKTDIYKAGAAPTFVKRGGKTYVIEGDSLPIGILNGVSVDKRSLVLKEDDIVLMVSDGVTATGCDWVAEELSAFEGDSPEKLAELIVQKAEKLKISGQEDDITAAAMILKIA